MWARFKDEWIDEVVGVWGTETEHVAVQGDGGGVAVRVGGICGDHCGVEVDVWGIEVIEDEAHVGEVGEGKSAETKELESVEVGLGVTQGDEVSLELLQMVQVIAFS